MHIEPVVAHLTRRRPAESPPYIGDPLLGDTNERHLAARAEQHRVEREEFKLDVVVRSNVANQVGSLIWAASSNDTANATVRIRRTSLATILPLVEEGLLNHSEDDDTGLAELGAALDDLRTAMSENDGGTAGEAN